MTTLLADPLAVVEAPELTLSDLVFGWGNEAWSGQPQYLVTCMREAAQARKPVLECGSGLTTVILGAIAQRLGFEVWSLEHLPEWGERVKACLGEYGITSVRLCVAPLHDYGDFHWYSPPAALKETRFGVVVCDGPPSATSGGRYGLAPVMAGCLVPGTVILLDDADRSAEEQVAQRWAAELPATSVRMGGEKGSEFFMLTVTRGTR